MTWAWILLLALAVGMGCDTSSGNGTGDDDGGTNGGEDAGNGNGDDGGGGTDDGGTQAGLACDESSPIELASDTSITRTIDTSDEPQSARPTEQCSTFCAENDVPDAVLEYTPPETGTLTVSTVSSNTTFDTVVSIYDRCDGSGSVLACNDDSGGEGHSRAVLSNAEAGEPVFIVVDGCQPDDVGEAEVTVELQTDSGSGAGSDSCDSPTELTFFSSGDAEIAQGSGDTSDATNDVSVLASCGDDEDAPDHFYAFDLELASNEGASLSVTVTPQSSDFDPMINVFRASNCSNPNLERCGNNRGPGEPDTLNTALVESDTYIIAIDGADGTSGPYDMTVTREISSGG
jgi:hypothetical protein